MSCSPGLSENLARPHNFGIHQHPSQSYDRPFTGFCGPPLMPLGNRLSSHGVLPSPIFLAPRQRYDVDSADRQSEVNVKLRDPQRLAKVRLQASASLESHTSLNSSHFLSPTKSTEFMPPRPQLKSRLSSESLESRVILNSSHALPQTGPTESESQPPLSKLTSSRKPRIEGIQRYEHIEDDKRRKKSQSQQIKQIKIDVMRLLLTTGTHSALLVIPPSLKVHKFATAGDFDSFLEMYAALLSAQQQKKKHKIKFRIDDLWERFHGRGGLHQIEALCSAFHDLGCNEDAVEELKDSFLASITSSENPDEVCRSLATHLTRSIKEFCLSTELDVEDESMGNIRDERRPA
jgi:hypothetical protein